jgi:hypothetical protein
MSKKKDVSIVLSEVELNEMLAIVKTQGKGACIVLSGPSEGNGINDIIHYGKCFITRAGETLKAPQFSEYN